MLGYSFAFFAPLREVLLYRVKCQLMLTFLVVTSTVLVAFGWLFEIAFAIESLDYMPDPTSFSPQQTRRLRWLLIVAHGGLLLAYGLLIMHLLLADTFPYSASPYEIGYPLEKAFLYFVVQMLYAFFLFGQLQSAKTTTVYPSLKYMISLTLFGVLASLLYNAAYKTAMCCENPVATYWGFPFSWLFGIARDPPFTAATRWTAYTYVNHYTGQMRWQISLWKLVADFCFWWSLVFMFSFVPYSYWQSRVKG